MATAQAQEQLSDRLSIVSLFAGDGDLRSELQSQASDSIAAVVFAGFVNVDKLPDVYALADVLVFPSSREAYGLSAREAICVGLPLIVSDQIGCVGPSDAARPDFNALVFPAGDTAALARRIVELATDPARMLRMGAASLQVADEMDLRSSIMGYKQAMQLATDRGVRPKI
jgi:glycosyltransferase involved in cell wall biosynthesis